MEIKKETISVDLFNRICEVRNDPNPIEYMVGVKLTDGRDCCFHTVKALDCDISTGELIGLCETAETLYIERIPRAMVLHRV